MTAEPSSPAPSIRERASRHAAPRLANILQIVDADGLPPGEAARLYDELPRWDLAIVDAEAVRTFRDELGPHGRLRRRNPDLLLLAYFSAVDVPVNWSHQSRETLFKRYTATVRKEWILRDVEGEPLRFFEPRPGDWHQAADLTTAAAPNLVRFLAQHVAGTGLVDGLFFDRLMTSVSWLGGEAPVATSDVAWVEGVKSMLAQARATFPPGFLVTGNAGWCIDPTFAPFVNGMLFEQFLHTRASTWTSVMRSYAAHTSAGVEPQVSVLMATSDEPLDVRRLRFALASALLFDGYFCASNVQGADRGYAAYARAHWLPEYDAGGKGWLGLALGEAVADDDELLTLRAALAAETAETRVWIRRYAHGLVLANPSRATRALALTDTYRMLDGSLVTSVTLEPRSGLLLMANVAKCRKEAPCVVAG